MSVLTKRAAGGDVIIYELARIVTREEVEIENEGEVNLELQAGYPVELDGTLVEAGNEGDVEGILCEPVTLLPGETRKVAVLARGPAAINRDALPTKDVDNANLNVDTLAATLATLGIVVRREPINKEEQLT